MSSSRLYSTEEVAELLGLHVRTIRTYVRGGKLRAVRIGKQYRIAHDDLVELAGSDVVASGRTAQRIEVTTVVGVEGIDANLLSRLTSVIGGAVRSGGSGREPLRVETIHDAARATAKVVIVGGPTDVAGLLTLIAGFSADD